MSKVRYFSNFLPKRRFRNRGVPQGFYKRLILVNWFCNGIMKGCCDRRSLWKLLYKPVLKSFHNCFIFVSSDNGCLRKRPSKKHFHNTMVYRHGSTTPGRCQPAPPRTLPVWADQWFYLFCNILSATHKECDETTRPAGKEARRTLPGIILLFYLTTNALMS